MYNRPRMYRLDPTLRRSERDTPSVADPARHAAVMAHLQDAAKLEPLLGEDMMLRFLSDADWGRVAVAIAVPGVTDSLLALLTRARLCIPDSAKEDIYAAAAAAGRLDFLKRLEAAHIAPGNVSGAIYAAATLKQTETVAHLVGNASRFDVNSAIHRAIRFDDGVALDHITASGFPLAGVFSDTVKTAAACGYVHLLERLIDARAQISAGQVLCAAAEKGQTAAVALLLRKTETSQAHATQALDAAVKGGHAATAQMLLDAGADINKSMLETAVTGGHGVLVDLLLRKGAEVNPHFTDYGAMAVMDGYGASILPILLRHGYNPAQDDYTCLRLACRKGDATACRDILAVLQDAGRVHGNTFVIAAVAEAASKGFQPVVAVFAKSGFVFTDTMVNAVADKQPHIAAFMAASRDNRARHAARRLNFMLGNDYTLDDLRRPHDGGTRLHMAAEAGTLRRVIENVSDPAPMCLVPEDFFREDAGGRSVVSILVHQGRLDDVFDPVIWRGNLPAFDAFTKVYKGHGMVVPASATNARNRLAMQAAVPGRRIRPPRL